MFDSILLPLALLYKSRGGPGGRFPHQQAIRPKIEPHPDWNPGHSFPGLGCNILQIPAHLVVESLTK